MTTQEASPTATLGGTVLAAVFASETVNLTDTMRANAVLFKDILASANKEGATFEGLKEDLRVYADLFALMANLRDELKVDDE